MGGTKFKQGLAISFLLLCILLGTGGTGAQDTGASSAKASGTADLAATPPMGWNSWDSYGATINEPQFRSNAEWMAQHLKSFGWQYVVIDEGWYVSNPTAEGNNRDPELSLDEFGRFTPAVGRFPSAANGAGFKPLADFVHSLGLKFGIHILRGVPKSAVERNLPIAGSSFHARDGADKSDLCPWNSYNFGAVAREAGQAYYDSIAKLYAAWGVDFLKVDCIASHPYKGGEIRMISQALERTGRPIVLSLSPGAAPLAKINELRQYAQMWRISDDIWDLWHSTTDYPQGVGDQFPRAEGWSWLAAPGHWPDADMLPLGHLGPAPGWGKPRDTRLTQDEQRTLLTLWCMFRSPLMMGGDLPSTDDWTLSLLTNPEVIAVDQHSIGSSPQSSSPDSAVWFASTDTRSSFYVAVFNLSEEAKPVRAIWKGFSSPDSDIQVRDLWQRKDLSLDDSLGMMLSPHASVLYLIHISARTSPGH